MKPVLGASWPRLGILFPLWLSERKSLRSSTHLLTVRNVWVFVLARNSGAPWVGTGSQGMIQVLLRGVMLLTKSFHPWWGLGVFVFVFELYGKKNFFLIFVLNFYISGGYKETKIACTEMSPCHLIVLETAHLGRGMKGRNEKTLFKACPVPFGQWQCGRQNPDDVASLG